MKESLKKKLISIFDWDRNKKIDWYEILFPIPDINRNKKVDWWEALSAIIVLIVFYGSILCGLLVVQNIIR
jgi:hypothetical protein|tara:strand:- start:208 stop:420 length:213 start_codon:yes stop_codon:yes gene_type:complete